MHPFPIQLLPLALLTSFFASQGDESPAWDVNAPSGPSREAPIDVASGTWMSLEVSPDGSEVVFDLLGDIHVVEWRPLEGISHARDVRLTMPNGRLCEADTLTPSDGPRGGAPRLFWHGSQTGLPTQMTDAGCVGCLGCR